jgi:ribosomal protein S18 acetylase RimI-like enzyme
MKGDFSNMESVIIRPLKLNDNFEEVAELIYYTDNWVYPALFDNQLNVAKKVIPQMIVNNTVFNYSNIEVAEINHRIIGLMVFMKEYPKNNYMEMKNAFMKSTGHLTPRFEETMNGYFNTLDFDFEGIQILNLCVSREFRNLSIAKMMIMSLDPNNIYSLACVKDNLPARKLYEKTGFKLKYEYPGFTGIMCVELVKNREGGE